MRRIAIIYGGPSPEHDVSLRSAYTIYTHIDRTRYTPILIGVDHHGRWYAQPDDAHTVNDAAMQLNISISSTAEITIIPGRGLRCSGADMDIDVALPMIHGLYGEDGMLQSLLECAEVPYIGSAPMSSMLGMNKIYAKLSWQRLSLPVAPFCVVTASAGDSASLPSLAHAHEFIDIHGLPLFVKPACGGSSIGISKIDAVSDLERAIRKALEYDRQVIIEQAIEGREIEIAILGNENIQMTQAGEIVTHASFYDYQAKYEDESMSTHHIPADLPSSLVKRCQQIAGDAYRAISASGMARVDFFIDTHHRIYINEINTLPGFTARSMYPLLWAHEGVHMSELINRLIDTAYGPAA